MKVHVQLFAAAREQVGADTVDVVLAEAPTVGALRRALAQQYPQLARLTDQLMFSVDADYANDRTELTAASDIAAIPPVSGG
jgi:molybdopterin converting factor subunit 1